MFFIDHTHTQTHTLYKQTVVSHSPLHLLHPPVSGRLVLGLTSFIIDDAYRLGKVSGLFQSTTVASRELAQAAVVTETLISHSDFISHSIYPVLQHDIFCEKRVFCCLLVQAIFVHFCFLHFDIIEQEFTKYLNDLLINEFLDLLLMFAQSLHSSPFFST